MVDRYALGDFTGSLAAAELLLGKQPDHPEAREYIARCRERLRAMLHEKVGPLHATYAVAVPESEIRWHGLDPVAATVLAKIGASATVGDLVDVAGGRDLDVLRALAGLREAGLVRRV
jgi:hypothetical protein